MNIHFSNEKLFNQLQKATLVKCKVGSTLYGTNNKNSDQDFLYIYATSLNELNSIIWSQHQLQYKENNIDHNFVSIHSFIKNIINGDSTINYEIIQSDELNNTSLQFIHDYKHIFNTYKIVKSYLGLCKRDLKYITNCTTEYQTNKQLEHINRGYLFAKNIMSLDENVFYNTINELKDNKILDISKLTLMVTDFRNELTELFNNNKLIIPKIINVNDGINLNEYFLNFQKTQLYKQKQQHLTNFDMSIFINSYENWVQYA